MKRRGSGWRSAHQITWWIGLTLLGVCMAGSLVVGAARYVCVYEGGDLYYSQDWNDNGLFSLDTSTGSALHIGRSGVTTAYVGLAPSDDPGQLYGWMPWLLGLIAVDGSGETVLAGSYTSGQGLAYDAEDDLLYSVWGNDLYRLDTSTGARVETLPSPGMYMMGLTHDPVRNLVYGIGRYNSNLMAYDPISRVWSTVGDTGLTWFGAGLAYDPANDILYAVGDAGGNNLYMIDPHSAALTLVGPTGLGGHSTGGLAFLFELVRYRLRPVQVVPMGYEGTFLDRDLPIGGGGATGGGLTVVGHRSLQAVYEIGETITGDWLILDGDGDLIRNSSVIVELYQLDLSAVPYSQERVLRFMCGFSREHGTYHSEIDTSGLAPGYYDFRLAFPDGSSETMRIELVGPTT
ncbi:MAG: hypothetical protein WBC63_05560 [Candidatus Bipolaricaulia bacterium]